MVLVKVEKIDENLIKEIVRRIVSVVDPVKIILFGSYVYGEHKEDSDFDILVIIEDDERPGYNRVVSINLTLSDMSYPVDVTVYTLREVEEWADLLQSLITTIVNKGRVVCEK